MLLKLVLMISTYLAIAGCELVPSEYYVGQKVQVTGGLYKGCTGYVIPGLIYTVKLSQCPYTEYIEHTAVISGIYLKSE